MNHTEFASTLAKHQAEAEHIDAQLRVRGPALIDELCETMTLSEIARMTGLNATYLKTVRLKEVRISIASFLKVAAITRR